MTRGEFEVLVIEPGGEHRVEKLGRGCEPLQQIVGGYIEAVSSEDSTLTFWVNEEGKLMNLEPNPVATAIWYRTWPGYRINDILVGSVAISGGADAEGETLSIPPAFRDEVLALFAKQKARIDAFEAGILISTTIRVMGLINGQPSAYDGLYVVEFDASRDGVSPDGLPMLAHLVTTPDKAKATRYETGAAFELWRSVDQRQPVRAHDGKPNRPFTAFTVEFDQDEKE